MQRAQRSRARGWRKPLDAISVSRRKGGGPVGTLGYWGNPYDVATYGRGEAISRFRQDVAQLPVYQRSAWLEPLRQAEVLLCWCKPAEACHADVLLDYLTNLTP